MADRVITVPQATQIAQATKRQLTELNGRLEELEGGGSGLSADAKQALLALLQKVAYTVIDGQDYYGALETALNPPANLRSISAVYTQSTPVYKNTDLDDLKADLVVTATYSDSSMETIASTAYALTGSLNAGTTSTITVNYGGKRTTFTVTVEPDALYPLEDGVKTWETQHCQLTVSNGNTVKGELLAGGSVSMFANISQVSLNTNAADSTNNNKVGTAKLFTIPAGATVVATMTPKYVNYYGSDIRNKRINVALRDSSGTAKLAIVPTTSYKELVVDTPIVNTFTAETDLDIWNITMWMEAEAGSICTVEFELELIVNGTKFI